MRIHKFDIKHQKSDYEYNVMTLDIEVWFISRSDSTILANEIQALIENYKEENGL